MSEVAYSPVFDVVAYGAAGDGSTNDAAAIQEAIDAATAAGGGIVSFPPGIYSIQSALVLKAGVVLEGAFGGITSTSVNGSTIRAGANLTNMIESNLVTAVQQMGIQNLLIDGEKATHTVGTGINLLGRAIRILNVDVQEVSGDGIHFQESAGKAWINWVMGCRINQCGGVGLHVECTDSRIIGNYIGNNDTNILQEEGGGNVYVGNQVDNATTAGVKIVSPSASDIMTNSFVGNYLDENNGTASTRAMWFTSHDGSTQYEWHNCVQGNTFRNNSQDIYIEDAIKPSIVGSEHRGGAASVDAIVCSGCDSGLFSGVQGRSANYSGSFFSGLPSNLSLRGCLSYSSGGSELRSEASGVATMLSGNTSVTVNHGLLGAPKAIVVTAKASSLGYWVSSTVTSTQFTILSSASSGSDKDISWIAWYTQ